MASSGAYLTREHLPNWEDGQWWVRVIFSSASEMGCSPKLAEAGRISGERGPRWGGDFCRERVVTEFSFILTLSFQSYAFNKHPLPNTKLANGASEQY